MTSLVPHARSPVVVEVTDRGGEIALIGALGWPADGGHGARPLRSSRRRLVSGLVFGLWAAMMDEISVAGGEVEQGN